MRNLTKVTVPVAMSAALAFAFTPTAAHAQQASEAAAQSQQKTCTAQVDPASVDAGQKAVQVQVKLSETIGNISGVEGDDVTLAAIADLPKAEMSRSEKDEKDEKDEKGEKQENETPQVVQMAAEGTSATLWLSTEKAKAGKQHLTLKGETGTCIAQIEVASGTKKEQ
jgi:murein L,D-transpeptidase YcbB/YkuD